ncbi:KUP system potassium uptake protein [Geodermatophilus tzadiensis]|uniref:Probable potassium transport system protein Kup n=1 Tax=Geodermatophilus tzadiensis TaxID=1137988 RepID=A0A2T0TTK6_9ACTN|nr:KUP/HAK/KT family potassium transporter [Geodermatophilus tzadiensis]PRY48999.1 KUP system potassium uptake protein [Geodermatophilus tzadiensis]
MAELVSGEVVPQEDPPSARRPGPEPGLGGQALVVGALGVVYGDIGTSPLYAMRTVFAVDGGAVRATVGDVLGVASLVFWSLTLTVSVKYVVFVLRADNDGEGGVLALAALVQRSLDIRSRGRAAVVMGLGVLGASLFYGDSIITPAISVLSAVEGLEVVSPGLSHAVLPLAVAVLTGLFAVQRWGTGRVGGVFGPVMFLWFAALAAAGLAEVVAQPGILRGLSPSYAVRFAAGRPAVALVAMGAVVLAVTGAEALYADLGQFGRRPIRRAWFLLVFPALTLNYLGQAALVARDPTAREDPFFLLLPSWAQLPMVVLATAATVIASQAVIAGAFSVSHQAMRLGYLPRLRVRHTSSREAGQVYVPAVNQALFVAVLLVVLAFGSSARLATAYGVAVTATFLITTALLLVVARVRWRWSWRRLVLLGGVLGVVELTYSVANLAKVAHGGWVTLLIAAALFTVMTTWRRGRAELVTRRVGQEGALDDVLARVRAAALPRVPGVAVYPHPTRETAPLALRATIDRFHVVHDRVVVITGRTTTVPHVPWDRRLRIEQIGVPAEGFLHVTAEFGFQDATDFPAVLRHAFPRSADPGGADDPDTATWFVTRLTLRPTRRAGPGAWRTRLFVVLASHAAGQADFLHLPTDRTVVMGARIDL